MKKKLIIILLLIPFLASCENLRLIGQGIKNSKDEVAEAIACVTVGMYPCAVVAGISGYAAGKEQTRDKIQNNKLINKNKKCAFLGFFCDD